MSVVNPATQPGCLARVDRGEWKGEFGRVTSRSQNVVTWRHLGSGTQLDFRVAHLTAFVPA